MLAGSRGPVAAYDARDGLRRYGRDASGMDPDDSDMAAQVAAAMIPTPHGGHQNFFEKSPRPEVVVATVPDDGVGVGPAGNGPTTPAQPDPSDDPDNYSDSNSAQPAPFAGRPSPGGQMEKGGRDRRFGQDARPRGYFDAFPANSRIIVES